MQMILRSHYLDVLKVLKGKNLIKVATGVRRCGKSTLMSQFQDVLRAENETASIISINIDVPDFRFLAEKSWKDSPERKRIREIIGGSLCSSKY
jgi:predicted AAA+ superfamily ATPase